MAQNITPSLEDLFYELRMLLGAAAVCQKAEGHELGNVINYFKDSVYVHARILYEFFTNDKPKNDAGIIQFGYSTISSSLYPNPLEKRLNRRVMHMNFSRGQNAKKEPMSTIQLNEQIQDMADDILRLFHEWINICDDARLKNDLNELVIKAAREAETDAQRMALT